MNVTIEGLFKSLIDKKMTVGTAESLTAGRISMALTLLPGSSNFFYAGITAYSNQHKVELLGVHMNTLLQHGAVSEECAIAMAEGARRKLGVDIAVSSTGIAGPDGGSVEKPVGLVYLAASCSQLSISRREVFDGDRECISFAATNAALLLLSQLLDQI